MTVRAKSLESTLAEMTELIGIQPTRGFDQGTPISDRLPDAGVRGFAMWALVCPDVDEVGDYEVTTALEAIAAASLAEWQVSLSLLLDANTETLTSVNISPEVIAALANAGGWMSVDA